MHYIYFAINFFNNCFHNLYFYKLNLIVTFGNLIIVLYYNRLINCIFLYMDGKKFCPLKDVLDRISDKWSIHVILILGNSDTLRFTDIKNAIQGISARMLTLTLQHLAKDGFVERYVYAQIPPRVEYRLTPLGKSLFLQLKNLSNWAIENKDTIMKARKNIS